MSDLNNWSDPDMSILNPARPAAPVLSDEDLEAVFGSWASWLKDAANVKGTPVDYVGLSLLCSASSLIGNARWAKPWEGWTEPTIIWAMLIGDPSSGKSPALDVVMDPIKKIEQRCAEKYQRDRRQWEDKAEVASINAKQWKKDVQNATKIGSTSPPKPKSANAGPPPCRERVSITDATTEKIADLLSVTWRGLLLYRDELSGWLGGMDRYNAGGDRSFWLEAFGGRPFQVDRKSNPEPIIVDHLSVSVLGGTQPDKLMSLLVNTDDDGLLARFLAVFPEPVPLSRPNVKLDSNRLLRAFERLRELTPAEEREGRSRPFHIGFTDEAGDVLQNFRVQCRKWETDVEGLLKGHIGKLPGLAVRVSCVLAHLDWAGGSVDHRPDCIEETHITRACLLVGQHLRKHAYRAYGVASVPKDIRNARKLAEVIQRDKRAIFTVRNFQRMELGGLGRAEDIKPALSVLVDANWLRDEMQKTAGRPKILYHVNPKLRRGI